MSGIEIQFGNQFLKVAMPKDAISLQATVKTASGIHKMTIDRWGDATHKYDHYNSRRHPSSRDEMAIRRYEADKAVMDPLPSPIPVIRNKDSIRCWPAPRDQELEDIEGEKMWHSHKHPNTRRERRRSPYYPPSPQYQRQSSEEREIEARPQPPEMAHDPQDPWATPQYETEEDVPDLVSVHGEENLDNTPPKRLRDFIESTEQLDQALNEATEVMKMLEKEPCTGGAPPTEPLKIAKTLMDVTPNKVIPMDGPDTKIANPGRHRNKVELHKAKISEVIFLEAPGSPEPDQAGTPPGGQPSGNVPLTPKILKINENGAASQQSPMDSDCEIVREEKSLSQEKQNQPRKILIVSGTRKRMSPCKCSTPGACTSEATSTTAGDSGLDSEDHE